MNIACDETSTTADAVSTHIPDGKDRLAFAVEAA
jgi:hypothetical protein